MAAGCESSSFQWITNFSQDYGVKGVGFRRSTSGRSAHDRSRSRQWWCNSIRSPVNSFVRILRRVPAKYPERRGSSVNDTERRSSPVDSFHAAIFILGRQRGKQVCPGCAAVGSSVNRKSVVRLGI